MKKEKTHRVSARVPISIYDRFKEIHPNRGEVTEFIVRKFAEEVLKHSNETTTDIRNNIDELHRDPHFAGPVDFQDKD